VEAFWPQSGPERGVEFAQGAFESLYMTWLPFAAGQNQRKHYHVFYTAQHFIFLLANPSLTVSNFKPKTLKTLLLC
jgi:hypothetical protein